MLLRDESLCTITRTMRYDDQARKQAVSHISSWRRPVLISHAKPDGDAIGSLLAMHSLLTTQGIQASPLLFETLPTRYACLPGQESFAVGDATQAAHLLDQADGVLIVDTCSFSQLEPVADWLKKSPLPKLVIDHHGTRDPITPHLLVDESAAATCLIIYELAKSAGWSIDAATASNLFIGLSTDTGWFRHSNTDARALHAAADLISHGVKAYELFESLYQQDSPGRIRLLGEALGTLELHADGRLAFMSLSRASFDRAQATAADTEDIVNEPLRIASVVVSVLLVEQPDGQIRINFRSKAPDSAGLRPVVDVAAIAKEFGGGGHRHAAGARSRDPMPVVCDKVRARIVSALRS